MNLESKQDLFRISFVVFVSILFALMFWPFFTPLLVAAIFAFSLENIVTRLTHRFKNRKRVVLGVLSVFFMFFTIPTLLIIIKAISTVKKYSSEGLQTTPLYIQTEQLLLSFSEKISEWASQLHLDMNQLPAITDILPKLTTWLAGQVTQGLSQIPQKSLSFLVFVVALYFFLSESHRIKKAILSFNLLKREEMNQIIHIIQSSSYLTLFSSLVVGSLQAFVVSIFSMFTGFSEFLVIFVVTFFFSLVPLVGAGPVAFFLAVLLFFQGQTGAGITMLVATGIASAIDNIIKPMILNSQTEDVHPALALLALVGAVLIYGPLGILLGPILTSLAFKVASILFPIHESDENMT